MTMTRQPDPGWAQDLDNQPGRGPTASPPAPGVFPPVNTYDDGDQFLVRAEIPGVQKESLDVTALGDELTIRGERVISGPEGTAAFHRRERESGQFRRVVTLPQPVNAEAIVATYRHGVLEVVLPRAAQGRPRKIKVR
jgi:HSP20 family protein